MTFLPEPPYVHGESSRSGVLLVNLGTPDAPEPGAVRRYLRQFLSDPRVVEIPRWIWWLILNGIVLVVRPRKSAAKYAAIWTGSGSPLRVYSELQATRLRELFAQRGLDIEVQLAMRYGQPSIASQIAALKAARVRHLLVLPMYPHYSAATSASALDEVARVLARTRTVPELRTVLHFHDLPGYIEALKQSVQGYWSRHGRAIDQGGKLIMSFHGIPRRSLDLGDPYHCECFKTGRLLAEALGLTAEQYEVSFQSRFGKAEWLRPYTAERLLALGGQGTARVDLICPGFVADCLETLEEIAQEGKVAFQAAGGGEYHFIPCLNGSRTFIGALADLIVEHMHGWPVHPLDPAASSAVASASAERARALGATA